MIQVISNQVEAETEFVRAVSPGHVIGMSVGFIGAEQRHPSVGLAHVRVSSEVELRHAALLNVRTVCAGNPQHVAAEVLSEVRA